MTCQEAMAIPNIVMGMLSIHGTFTYVLFDSGSTYSFISCALATKLGLRLDKLSQSVVISTSIRKTFVAVYDKYRWRKISKRSNPLGICMT